MKVHELLDNESKWAKGSYAFNAEGRYCYEWADEACKWCLLGAIHRCYPCINMEIPEEERELSEQERVIGLLEQELRNMGISTGIANYNDAPDTTFEQVKTLVTKLNI